jgi:adenylate cyclase
MTERQQRRLAAILAADIAGYSVLMGADDEVTVRDLKAHQAVVLPLIRDHGGRIIDTAGDGILAEFASVVNAIESAVAVQRTMGERNAGIETGRQMLFRIGINLGDVIHDEARVYGDGVNIAARLEALAEPGSICISAAAHDQARKKLAFEVTDLGLQHLKNIDQPVRVYRIDAARLAVPGPNVRSPLALPDKPSIAVLPFTNLSGDKEQEYFSDGITEDIITELSRFSDLFVIARNSSFTYKGKAVDIRQVGRELGVRYVLEGSIRRGGDSVRITGQLIDAITGAHRWAERYDRKLEDVFAVQDEVARTIVAILAAHVNKAEAERTLLKPPTAWLAYDYYMRAGDILASFFSSFRAEQLYEARHQLDCALLVDPNYARAYARLSHAHLLAYVHPLDSDFMNFTTLERAHQLASRAIQLGPNLPECHAQLAWCFHQKGQHDASIGEFERAIALNPNFTDWRFAGALVWAGDFTRAVRTAEAHMRLDPFYPAFALRWLASAQYMLKKYAEALPPLRECVSRAPYLLSGRTWLAATYAQLGRADEASNEAVEVLRIAPNWTINGVERRRVAFRLSKDFEQYADGLRKAGLPE